MTRPRLSKTFFHHGVSLLEVLISMVILSLVIVGLANVIVLSKNYLLHARTSTIATELARHFLDPLQEYVRQDTWDKTFMNNLSVTESDSPGDALNVSGKSYTPYYNITNLSSLPSLRKVKLTIKWNETYFNE